MAPVLYTIWLDMDLPIWVFHGEEDEAIEIIEAQIKVEKLKKLAVLYYLPVILAQDTILGGKLTTLQN